MSSDSFIIAGLSIPSTILTIICNTVFFITLLKTSSLHTPSNILLGAMCVTDLLAGLVCQPLYIAYLLGEPGPARSSIVKALNFAYNVTCWNSFVSSLLITLDRYVAICYPYKYQEYATCRKYVYTASCTFVFFVIYAIIQLTFYKNSEIIFWSVQVSLQLLVIIAVLMMYARIYRVVLSQRKRIASIRDTSGRRKSGISFKERNRTHTVTIILAVFIACYAPHTVYCVERVLYHLGNFEYHRNLALWANYFVLLNSCLNPIIYCARSQEIRRAAVKFFMPNSQFARDPANTVTNFEENKGRTDPCVATSE